MDTIKIPNALQVMMDQLFMNNSLKSWGVFPNKYGQLCLNIRFDICELDQSSKPVSACAFRRISDKQLVRNASRNINNNKRRKLNPSISMEDKTISQTYQFSKPVYPSPELARSSSVPVTPDAGYIDSQDSPILPVEEDSPANSVKEGMKMNMECDSIFKYYSPAISTPLNSNLERNLNSLSNISNINPILHPILKQDAASQVDYVTSSNSTQTDYIQKHQIIQCSAKIRSKSTQSGLVKVSEESIQVDPAPIVQINSSIQHQPITADKFVQMGSDIIPKCSPEPDPNQLKSVYAPEYNKRLCRTFGMGNTFCYLARFKIFDEKGHCGYAYHRCENCKTFICDVCIDYAFEYQWANCCPNPESDGVIYSSGLEPIIN